MALSAEHDALAELPVWRHLVAMVYDLFLIVPLLMLTSAALLAVHGPVETAATRSVPAWQQWLLGYAALIGFYGVFWRQKGQTLGMQAWRVKLVSRVGLAPISWQQATIRVISASVPLILALIPYVFFDIRSAGIVLYVTSGIIASSGFLWRWTNTERLYFHDYVSQSHLRLTPPRNKGLRKS